MAAARTAAVLWAVGAATSAGFAVVAPAAGAGARAVAWAVPVALLGLAVLALRLPSRWMERTALAGALLGVVAIAAVNLHTRDASAAAQVTLCLPVLYAASQLRRLGAALTAVTAVTADALVVVALLPPAQAATDAGYVVATLVTMTVLMVRAGERQDRLVARLHVQASTDPLTGLRSRRSFDEAVVSALQEAPAAGVALLLVDVDGFKGVNDTWGHPVGDEALRHLAACLRSAVETGVGAGAVVGRPGGDELAAVLHGCTDARARVLARRVAETVRTRPLPLEGGRRIALSVSVGVGHTSHRGVDLHALYVAADADLYRAKHARVPSPSGPPATPQPALRPSPTA